MRSSLWVHSCATIGFSAEFKDWYLLPMIGCIWSGPARDMLRFPVGQLARFCHNHGLLQITDRPQWRTVVGGSREYVRKIVGGLEDARLRTPVLCVLREREGVQVVTRIRQRNIRPGGDGRAPRPGPGAAARRGPG